LKKRVRLFAKNVPCCLAAIENTSVTLDKFKTFVDGFQVDCAFSLAQDCWPSSRIFCIATSSGRIGHDFHDDVWFARREKVRVQMLQRSHCLGERRFFHIAVSERFWCDC
jgi:hypothetical protein